MPCYIQIRLYTETFDSIAAMQDAAKAMGLRVETRGSELWIGGILKARKLSDGKYEIKTQDSNTLSKLMDEYAAAKITRKAKRQNKRVQKSKSNTGEITLKIVG